MTITSSRQADILAKYLINQNIRGNEHVYKLYAIATLAAETNEQRLVTFAFDYPWTIPYLDAALVFLRPQSELRRRIYVMFAILESMPDYTDLFLPSRFNFFETVGIFLAGIRAVFRMIIGVIIIKVIHL